MITSELSTIKSERLFAYLKKRYAFRYDYQLAHFLEVAPGTISDLRGGRGIVTHRFIVAVLDRTDLSIRELREMIGMPFIPGDK